MHGLPLASRSITPPRAQVLPLGAASVSVAIPQGLPQNRPPNPALGLDSRIAEAFVLAMRAEVTLAPYGAPYVPQLVRPEWLIVSRWGAMSEYLSLSRTGVPAERDGVAPDSLQPRETFFGLRVAGPAVEPCFLLLRQLPPDMPVAGAFLPTDGFVRLTGPTTALRLMAAGRHAHVRGRCNGATRYADVPHPPPEAEGATAWSINAIRRPWLGDVIDAPRTGFG
jgi:hypothetical protein